MIEIQATEAKTHLSSLLTRVQQGETVIITRHGQEIAHLIPAPEQKKAQADKTLAGFRAFRKRVGPFTREEILSSIHEGHKY